MKKRILSAIALTMALSMTFGMTAFASSNSAINPSAGGVKSETITSSPVPSGSVTVADDEKATLEAEAKTAGAAIAVVTEGATVADVTARDLKEAKTVAAKVAEANNIANATVTVLAAKDITIANYTGSFVITLDKAVNPATTVVLHLNLATNAWETLKADVADDGKTITVYAASLSPIVIAEVKAGETSNGSSSDAGSATTSPAESPKTGAVASAAGIMAGICLAGAAVSAKKVREEN